MSLKIIILILPLILFLYYYIYESLNKQNNDYNKDTKYLIIYKKIIKIIIVPISNWIKSFIQFLKDNDIYIKIWVIFWICNLNLLTIIIEFFAFYFYFTASFDFKSIYTQIVKLFLDLNIIFNFIPLGGWFLIIYIILDKWRKNIAYNRLNHYEMKNRGFINSTSLILMAVGTMGKKKTTTITDIALSQEVMLRDKAFELILENDLKFPYFPWINLENEIKKNIQRGYIYNLASCKKWIRNIAKKFIIQIIVVMNMLREKSINI